MFKILSAVILALSAPLAHAGILFEPYVGYHMGDIKSVTILPVETNEGSIDGFSYGGRVGWMFGGFFLGGEYQATRAKEKLDDEANAIDWSNTSVFGVIGLQSMIGLRILAGMTVQPHESEEATQPNRMKYTGSAQKIGIGYRYFGMPFAINGEYIMYKLEKYDNGLIKANTNTRFSKLTYNAVMLSISFPFDFGGR